MKLSLTDLPADVNFFEVTINSIQNLWERMKDFDPLFSDNARWDQQKFIDRILNRNTVILEIENGIMFLSEIIDNHYAQIHACFWDHKLSARVNLLKETIFWAFNAFNLVRLEAIVPDFSRGLKRFLEHKLMFVFEGRLRKRMFYHGIYEDIVVYSLLKSELNKLGECYGR